MIWNEISRFATFAIIGAFNAVLDTIVWKFLVNAFEKSPTILRRIKSLKLNQYSFSHGLSFIVSATSSYFLNKTFTFGDSQVVDPLQPFKFAVVAIFSLIITTYYMNWITSNRGMLKFRDTIGLIESQVTKRESLIKRHWPLLAKLSSIAISMVTNFIGYRLLVF